MTEPRKATDVLLDVESKVNTLLDIVRSQDLVIKVLSNKLNDVIGRLDKQQSGQPKIVVEAVNTAPARAAIVPPGFDQIPAGEPERNIPITAESRLPESSSPQGFRRSSRPETYAGDNAYLPHPEQELRMPVQLPKMPSGKQNANPPPPGREPSSDMSVMAPPEAMANPRNNKRGVMAPPNPFGSGVGQSQQNPQMEEERPAPLSAQGQVPVMQRCVDKNGKSVFLAPVEITDLSNGQIIFKGRTNGTGKWMASLGIGGYRVVITKQASMNKEKLEAVQDIQVDGTQSPLELPMMIIK
jgi:hypothetical protein